MPPLEQRDSPNALLSCRTLWELRPAEGQGSRWLHEAPEVRTQPTAPRQLLPVAPTGGQLQAGLRGEGVDRAVETQEPSVSLRSLWFPQ